MFTFIKLATQVILKPFQLGDRDSCKKFLIDVIQGIKPLAAANKIKLDDDILAHLQVILNNDALFAYVYQLILNQLQTKEILLESADEDTILELCDNTTISDENNPKAINPIVIITLVSQIVSIINAIKANK